MNGVRLDQTLRRLDSQLDRLLDAFQQGALTVPELKARRERLEAPHGEAARARLETLVAHQQDRARLDRLA